MRHVVFIFVIIQQYMRLFMRICKGSRLHFLSTKRHDDLLCCNASRLQT